MASSVIDTLIAEAGSDPEGLRAVAWVIQNRATQWGMTPEQVVKQKGQFEGYYKPGPKSKQAQKMPKVRAAAEKAWNEVVSGTAPDPTNGGTSFRAKGTKQPAPNGTVEIGGNVFALGSAKPNSALAAINAVAPTPMPSRPVALGYSQNTAIPSVPALRSSAPPGMKSLIEGNAAFGVLPFDRKPDPASYVPNYGIDLNARDLNPPIVPARGVGTSYLAPATKVKTVPIDPVTGNPILAQATPSPRSPVGYGPIWDNLKGMTVGAWDDAAPWNNVGPRPKPFVGGVVPSQSKQTPQQIANERVIAGIPVLGPLAVGLGTLPALLGNTRTASATPQPQPTKLPSLAPPTLTAAQRSALASTASVPKPAYEVAPPLQSTPIKVATTIKDGKLVVTKAPTVRDVPKPYDRFPSAYPISGDDIASALYPKPAATSATKAISAATAPRLPMMPPTAMSAARLPQIAPPTPRAPARVPLAAMGTVNPTTQIVPAVQARAGQTLFGRLFNNMTSGVVPQPAAPTNRPAWQNNPNVQRDDKWAGVLDNFGMII